jgi:RNA binding exosome subunit
MLMKSRIFLAFAIALSTVAYAQLSNKEVANALKEALTKGISKGADLVSVTDGYFKNPEIKIPFPPEVKKVETKLRQMGMGKTIDNFVLTLNRSAEEAAKESKPIFIDAIKQLTINDALSILKGTPDAATQFLKRTTTTSLKEKFSPIVQAALDRTSATKYYKDITSTYNKIPLVTKVNPDLNAYATDKAIEGLFVMIAKEEKNIRENPVARTTDLLKKVFGFK